MNRLDAKRLYTACDPALIPFDDTAQVAEATEATGPVGHARALRAIEFAFDVDQEGYNLFVTGSAGIGKLPFVRAAIESRAKHAEALDWVYVNRFDQPERPLALGLPRGRGAALRDDMRAMIDELKATIPAAFESETYATEVERIRGEITDRHAKALAALGEEAMRDGIALVQTPNGFTLAPVKDGEVMEPAVFAKLPETEQQRVRARILQLQDRLQRIVRDGVRLRKEQAERVTRVNRETTAFAVQQAFDELRARYLDLPAVLGWLDALRDDLLAHSEDFLRSAQDAPVNPFLPRPDLGRYEVNLLCSRQDADGAPVVEVEHPTLAALVGRIDHQVQMGNLVTDFRLIRLGMLHRANGGYLLIDARRLLTEPFAWAALKRALQRRHIVIESIAEQFASISTVRLEPEPIPLDVKVVLFGDRMMHRLLSEYDPDFSRLFRVIADFDEDLARDDPHVAGLSRVIAAAARTHGLLPITRDGVARLIEQGARLAGDASRMTAQVQRLLETAVEADRIARRAGNDRVRSGHVAEAIASARDRAGRAAESHQRAIGRGVLMIDTAGECIGQVNGLALFDVAGHAFGHPSRITATTRPGEGHLIDIQRETEMAGPIHTRGVLILGAFLAARYSARQPLSLSASLVFEQNYGPVEGDSATVAELCALLSSLSGIPVRQGIAVTGSMNQLGEVQPIGGVNEKIEGFFDICDARGLDGVQGVVIPAANVGHLMVSERVRDAVTTGRFHVWAVSRVDEAIERLMGVPAGSVGASAASLSVNRRVADRLREFGAFRRIVRPKLRPRVRAPDPDDV